MRIKRVEGKLANMRKPQAFSIQRDQVGTYLVQSVKSIGKFDGKGRGILNTTGCYFHHLSPMAGAKSYLFPAAFGQECQEIFVRPGETLGGGVVVYGGLTSVGAVTTTMLEQYLAYENNFATHDKSHVELGTPLWNIEAAAYQEYQSGVLTGLWRRRSPEDFDIAMKEQIAEEFPDVL